MGREDGGYGQGEEQQGGHPGKGIQMMRIQKAWIQKAGIQKTWTLMVTGFRRFWDSES